MPEPQRPCVYQFKVVLRGNQPDDLASTAPARATTPSPTSLRPFEIALGWSDAHLNHFHLHGKDYGVAHEGGFVRTFALLRAKPRRRLKHRLFTALLDPRGAAGYDGGRATSV